VAEKESLEEHLEKNRHHNQHCDAEEKDKMSYKRRRRRMKAITMKQLKINSPWHALSQ
jgi:hypothetical protein